MIKGGIIMVMETTNEVSCALQEPLNILTFFAKNSSKFFEEFEIPKANGETRVLSRYFYQKFKTKELETLSSSDVSSKREEMNLKKKINGSWHLRQIHNKINNQILKQLDFPEFVHGFLPERSTITAVRPHVGKEWLIAYDIKDFFGSTTAKLVRKSLEKHYGFGNSAAWLLSKLVTCKNKLPQGAVSSPIASNVAFAPFDMAIGNLCNEYGIAYTRYADDLIFSGFNNEELKNIVLEEIPGLMAEEYKLNKKKTKIFGPNDIHYALGYIVNTKVNVNRTARRNLEAAIYNFVYKKQIPVEHISNPMKYKRSLLGKASYMLKANPDLGRLKMRFEELKQFDPNKAEFEEYVVTAENIM